MKINPVLLGVFIFVFAVTVVFIFAAVLPSPPPRYRQTVPFMYNAVQNFSEGLAAVSVSNPNPDSLDKWGFIDKNNVTVIPFIYDYLRPFSEGMAAFGVYNFINGERNMNWGFIDNAGNTVVPPDYGTVLPFSHGLAAVRVGDWQTGKWGFIDKTGGTVIPFIYDEAQSFREGLAAVKSEGKWGFIDISGNLVIPHIYNTVFLNGFNDGLAMVSYDFEMEGTYGYINKLGETVVPFNRDIVYWAFESGTDWYLRPLETEPRIQGYDRVMPFYDGIAAVGILDNWEMLWGFIDENGSEIIPVIYGSISDLTSHFPPGFINGFAVLRHNGKFGVLDKNGDTVVPFEYDAVMHAVSEGMLGVMRYETRTLFGGDFDWMTWGFLEITETANNRTGDGSYVFYLFLYALIILTLLGLRIYFKFYRNRKKANL
jgi:hypothetical protein